jgi:hypothetical protein
MKKFLMILAVLAFALLLMPGCDISGPDPGPGNIGCRMNRGALLSELAALEELWEKGYLGHYNSEIDYYFGFYHDQYGGDRAEFDYLRLTGKLPTVQIPEGDSYWNCYYLGEVLLHLESFLSMGRSEVTRQLVELFPKELGLETVAMAGSDITYIAFPGRSLVPIRNNDDMAVLFSQAREAIQMYSSSRAIITHW